MAPDTPSGQRELGSLSTQVSELTRAVGRIEGKLDAAVTREEYNRMLQAGREYVRELQTTRIEPMWSEFQQQQGSRRTVRVWLTVLSVVAAIDAAGVLHNVGWHP